MTILGQKSPRNSTVGAGRHSGPTTPRGGATLGFRHYTKDCLTRGGPPSLTRGDPLPYVQGQVFDSLIEIPSNLRATWGTPSPTRGDPPPPLRVGDPPPLRVGDPPPLRIGSGFRLPYKNPVEFESSVVASPVRGVPPSPTRGTLTRGGPPPLPHVQIWPK